MNTLETINHFWPNTVVRFGLKAEDFPFGLNPVPCMNGFVELVSGATLPSDADIQARQAEYNAYVGQQLANNGIKQQIEVLENSITSRRRDEAILGQDSGWLSGVRSQIASLRAQLK